MPLLYLLHQPIAVDSLDAQGVLLPFLLCLWLLLTTCLRSYLSYVGGVPG